MTATTCPFDPEPPRPEGAATATPAFLVTPSLPSPDGVIRYDVRRGREANTVTVHYLWRSPALCTCADSRRQARERTGGCCQHVLAVLIASLEELRLQLHGPIP